MTDNKDGIIELSPDGYSRFFILVDLLKQAYGNSKKKINILDVGGGSKYLEEQLQTSGLQYDLTIIDVIKRPEEVRAMYIQGDATNMDFGSNSYDAVVSTDVLEHIPESKKHDFIYECLRVAKDLCVIAAPFTTPGVHEAEVAVNDFNKKLFGSGQNWLEEHLQNGKPSTGLISRILHKANISYDEFGTQNLVVWLLNTHINLIDAKLGLNHREHVNINKFYNNNILLMNEFSEPTYRRFFVMYKDGKLKKKINVNRYVGALPDPIKVTNYISELMRLLADKIEELNKNNLQLRSSIEVANQKISLMAQESLRLQEIVQRQNAKLDKLKILIMIGQSKPVAIARRIFKEMRK